MSSRPYPPAIWARFFPVIIVFGLLVILVYLNRRNDSLEDHPSVLLTKDSQDGEKATTEPGHDLNQYTVMTHIGYISLHELNEKVFKAFGYKISKPSLPVPTLEMINEPSCETVFAEWLEISQKPQPDAPPKQLPGNLTNEFLMHGYTAISNWYFNDKKGGDAPRNWDKISEYMKFSKSELSALAYSFNKESESVYHAMSGYPLDGMDGFIVGSMQPWVEVMALQHGAKHILTVEYNPLEIPAEFKNRLSSILPVDFVKNWQDYAGTFDFAASFSSIEHSGLGRYGDPVDPIGDLREMLKIKCMLKKGGLLFLGLPYGTDAMQFNAHRIYGSIRIAMMIYGFDWLASYSGESEQPFDLDSRTLHAKPPPNLTQYTLVLRKL
ncbi:Protein CBG21994 [Caenorhabditis briggsae]|uniref:DUF268 domain-containing protein n=2 Tax=Caenorhabditis briggsae TaxID=6238 RepID=A0AAE9CYI4_CAEBR|nr:Protein CBG21994 [Caenorhabditis briggsae]ULT87694.1 hypothetical protein L3Y34_007097 [Caenorhabditis briggsae]CAP38676.2 Protein CBG21994 [Caenorhabditis briggsae]